VTTENDWAHGYRQQALADMEGARLIQGGEPSVLAMLLQMVLEKLADAALLRSGMMQVSRAESTHQAVALASSETPETILRLVGATDADLAASHAAARGAEPFHRA
jgi:hypothetical protein